MSIMFDYLPENAVYWLADEGAGNVVESNLGTVESRVNRILIAENIWGIGRYKSCIERQAVALSQRWGDLPTLNDIVPIEGRTELFIEFWVSSNGGGLLWPWRWLGWDFGLGDDLDRVYVPWRYAGTPGHTVVLLGAGALPLDGNLYHYAFRMWVEAGQVKIRVARDGAEVYSNLAVHAADDFPCWQGGNQLLYSGPNSIARMDELVIAPGWLPTDGEVLAMATAPTIQPRAVVPCGA